MPRSWEINAEWEYLDSGLPEERACFAALSIYAHAQCLTEGRDAWANPGDRLFPATRAYTYRQKMQRAFAAELLSPHESVAAMLDGDASEESQQDVASYFQVSDWTIHTLLVNNGILDRNDLDGEQFALAA